MTVKGMMTDELFMEILRRAYKAGAAGVQGKIDQEPEPATLVVITAADRTLVEFSQTNQVELTINVILEMDENKYRMIHALGRKFGREQAPILGVCLFTEAWISCRTPEMMAHPHPENIVPPVEDPDRTEAVVAFGANGPTQRAIIQAPIHRDRRGRASLGEPLEITDGAGSDLIDYFLYGWAIEYGKELGL